MAYVKKIIGNDERIIGIARLHWIYLARGLFAFTVCMTVGLIINTILFKVLEALGNFAPNASQSLATSANSLIMPLSIIVGGTYFLFFLLKVLYTEIALTERRIIYKRGFLFVKIQEIDIEEISGENMDMGYFGSILGYGYIMLDCRFVGDVTLPAISKANSFIKALHAARTQVQPVFPDTQQVGTAPIADTPPVSDDVHSSDEKPEHEMLKPPAPTPVEEINEEGELVLAEMKPEENTEAEKAKQAEVAAVEHDKEKEILQLEIAKLELEVKLKEIETSETETWPEAAIETVTPTAPAVVVAAQAVKNDHPEITKMPQVTDKIAEELIAQGLIPHPDEIKPEPEFTEEPLRPKAPTDEERLEPTKTDALINSFGSAAFVFKSMEDGVLKPAPSL